MNANIERARAETNARLHESRNELRHLLHDDVDGQRDSAAGKSFPRSKTLQLLTSSRVLTVLAVAALGAVVMRPRIATRLIRLVPISTIARFAAIRFFTQLGQKNEH